MSFFTTVEKKDRGTFSMSVAALFRGKWGAKSPENADSHLRLPSHDEYYDDDEEDDSKVGLSREPIRRNSRFYRSMRKKRMASAEQSDSSPRAGVDTNSSTTSPNSSSVASSPHKTTELSGAGRPALPSNGEASSRYYALYSKEAVNKGRGGVGGGSGDISAASHNYKSPLAADDISYRTHSIHGKDIKQLSEQTTAACTVRDVGRTMSSGRPSPEGTDRDSFNHRLRSNGDSSKTISHSLNIVKNIAFLYQEYRDTSKQQEIEQRRQRENLSGTTLAGSNVSSAPVVQLQLRNNARSLSLWQNLEVVQASGLLTQLPQKEIIMQEAMFELITSEASYYKSLEILENHFLRNPELINTLSPSDMHFLFSNIEEVMKASERFLMDLEHRVEKSILISDVCDIVYNNAVEHFSVFVKYVINQVYQEKNYRRIL